MPAVKKVRQDEPDYREAWLRLLFLWRWARESEKYVKKDWIALQGRLNRGEDVETVMWDAEFLYEWCQAEEWPLQFD